MFSILAIFPCIFETTGTLNIKKENTIGMERVNISLLGCSYW